MSLSPDPTEISPPRDPAEYRPRPLIGVSFWLMMVLAVVCVAAGVALAQFGPQVLGRHLATSPPAATTPRPALRPANPPAAPPGPAPSATSDPAVGADIQRLSTRVALLELEEAHTTQAATAALAAAAVVEASQGSGPFADQLAGLRAITAPSPELTVLTRLAEAGAPSRAALAADFPEYAARAASAAHTPGDRAGLGDRIAYALSRIVSLRRVGDVPGAGPDALLARAERQVADGDLDRALLTLDALPAASREALAPWRVRAERRAEIDRNAAALRSRALQALAAAGAGG